MDDLPDEVLLNILERVPIKSLGVCMCVNKQWLSLIKIPSFVNTKTLLHNREDKKSLIFLIANQLQLYRDDGDDEGFDLHKRYALSSRRPDKRFLSNSLCVCNGVICILKDDFTIELWNPTIRKTLTLPKSNFPSPLWPVLGFGFDSLTNDYKLVRIDYSYRMDYKQVEIFSLNGRTWKVLPEISSMYLHNSPPPTLNGALHWLACDSRKINCQVILAFHLNAEVFQKIELPQVKGPIKRLCVYKESFLALIRCYEHFMHSRVKIWVMKEYGNEKSWTKMLNLKTPISFGVGRTPWSIYKVIGLRYNGEVFLQHNQVIASVDPETTESKWELELHNCSNYDITYFKESLVLLDISNAESYNVE